jgi:hypothetical protein
MAMRRRRSCWSTRNRAVAAPPSVLEIVLVVVASNTEELAGEASVRVHRREVAGLGRKTGRLDPERA